MKMKRAQSGVLERSGMKHLRKMGAAEHYPGPKLLADQKDIRKVTSRFS